MDIRTEAVTPESLGGYSSVPIAFVANSRLDVEALRASRFSEIPITPFLKDYDGFVEERPTQWPRRFDVSNWVLLTAWDGEARIGGAAVAWSSPGVDMLEGRDDLVVLWDIRVHPDHRGRGVGRRLFRAAVEWARGQEARELKVETQDINVDACRFYARQGCRLSEVNRGAYGDLDEVQLIWRMGL